MPVSAEQMRRILDALAGLILLFGADFRESLS
jgi:hypothetical protein